MGANNLANGVWDGFHLSCRNEKISGKIAKRAGGNGKVDRNLSGISAKMADWWRYFSLLNSYLSKTNILIMIYLLGGPPRVGKSIISNEIRQKHAVSVVSTDTLGAVLENVLSPEETPDLFVFDQFNKMPMAERVKLMTKDPAELIGYVRKESHVVWIAVEAYIRRENDEGRDALIEGVAVLPELISRLDDIPHRVVFIGNQGDNHKENIKKSAEENEHDWMRDVSDQYIGAFAMFVQRMSAYIEQEAKKYGFEYIEMDKELFGDVTEEVMKSLGLNTR